MLAQICPITPSRDFEVTWYRDQDCLLMSRDKIEAHFFSRTCNRPETSNHGEYLSPKNTGAYCAEIAHLSPALQPGFSRFQSAKEKPLCMRGATTWDPDGDMLRVGEGTGADG